MFHIAVACAMISAIEDDRFEKLCCSLPPEEAKKLREQRAADRERARQEAEVERRHRELIRAIRLSAVLRG